MPEEITPAPGAEGAEETGSDVIVTPTKEESVDARIEKAVTPLHRDRTDPLEEADEALEEEEVPEEVEEVEEEEVPEKKEVVPTETIEAPVVEPIIPVREPSSIDKRIVEIYQETEVLQGKKITPSEELLAAISSGTLAEKQAALHRLLKDRKTLRNNGVDDGQPLEVSEEDREALIQAEVDERFNEVQNEIRERELAEDLVKTYDETPILQEDSKEYNPKIADAVARLAQLDPETGEVRGMKVSEALALVMETVEAATEKDKKAAELKKQKALSGVVSPAGSFDEGEGMTDEEIKELRTKHPKEYNRLVKLGKI